MFAKVQEHLRNNIKGIAFAQTKLGSVGGIGAPISSLQGVTLSQGAGSGRTYSPREAKAVANSRKGRQLAPMPVVGAMPPNMGVNMALLPPGMTLPPGFDYRNLPMGLPHGIPFPAGVDPEAYKKGIRWAPVQAGSSNQAQGAAGSEGHAMTIGAMLPLRHPHAPGGPSTGSTGPGMWPDMQFIPPHPNAHYPHPPYQSGQATPQPKPQRRTSSSSSSQPQSTPSASTVAGPATTPAPTQDTTPQPTPTPDKKHVEEPSENPVNLPPTQTPTAASGSGSAFNSTPLQGRTIYSASASGPFTNGAGDKETRTESPSNAVKNGGGSPKQNPKPEVPKKGRKSGGAKSNTKAHSRAATVAEKSQNNE